MERHASNHMKNILPVSSEHTSRVTHLKQIMLLFSSTKVPLYETKVYFVHSFLSLATAAIHLIPYQFPQHSNQKQCFPLLYQNINKTFNSGRCATASMLRRRCWAFWPFCNVSTTQKFSFKLKIKVSLARDAFDTSIRFDFVQLSELGKLFVRYIYFSKQKQTFQQFFFHSPKCSDIECKIKAKIIRELQSEEGKSECNVRPLLSRRGGKFCTQLRIILKWIEVFLNISLTSSQRLMFGARRRRVSAGKRNVGWVRSFDIFIQTQKQFFFLCSALVCHFECE